MIDSLLQSALRSLVMGLVILAAGCGSQQPEPRPKPSQLAAQFEPRILDNGTKLFTYTVELPRPPTHPTLNERSRPADAPIESWVRHLLEQNGYCRDDFFTLEQYRAGARAILRGECRDGATAEDRSRF